MEKFHKHRRKFKRKKNSLELTKDITRKKKYKKQFFNKNKFKGKDKDNSPKKCKCCLKMNVLRKESKH